MQLDADRAMDEAVEDGVGDGGIAQLTVPIGHRQLAGDDHRAPAEAVVEDFEEVARPRRIDGRQAPVVEDQHLDAGEIAVELRDGALAMGDPQLGEEPRHALVLGQVAFEARLVAESARDPTLARAAWAGDQDMGAVADPGAVCEAEHEAAVEATRAAQVDVLEACILMAQLRPLEAPLQGPGAALGDLAVDQQRQAVHEGHIVEVVARHLLEEGGVHAA